MTADEFATRIKSLAPSVEDLLGKGLTTHEVEEFRLTFHCHRTSKKNTEDPVLDLCNNFDVSSLEISLVRLCPAIAFQPGFVKVGVFESDPMVLSFASGEIAARDHGSLNRVICRCSRNSAAMLEALLLVAEANNIPKTHTKEDVDHRLKVLAQCCSLAGTDSRPFYFVLLGIS